MDTSVEMRYLRTFVAAAQELHFGRAAQQLGIAQPLLSQQIHRLEARLGCALFVRTSRSIRLTPPGEVLLRRARRSLRDLAEDLDEVRSVAAGRSGSLRLAVVSSAVLTFLPDALRRYRQVSPGVQIQLREMPTAEVTSAVVQARADAGIVRDPDPDPRLISHTLYREPYVAMLPREHPAAGAGVVSVADLAADPFVLPPRSAGTRAFDQVTSLCGEHGFQPRVVQEASHWLTVARLVAAGLGVSIAPECVQTIAGDDVVCLPLRESTTSELAVLLARDGAPPAAVTFDHHARAVNPQHAKPAEPV